MKGTKASSLSFSAKIVEQVVLVPIFLLAWSTELYGEWLLISVVPTYFAMSDFGLLQSCSNELARRVNQDSADSIRIFFKDYTSFLNLIVLFILFLSIIFITFNSVTNCFNLEKITEQQAKYSVLILVLSVVASLNTNSLAGAFRANGIIHKIIYFRAIVSYIRVLSIFIVLYFLEAGVIEVALVILISRLIEYFYATIYVKKFNYFISYNPFRRRRNKMSSHLIMGFQFMLIPLSTSFSLQGVVILIGVLISPSAVAIFSIHRTLARTSTSALQVIIQPLWSEIGLRQEKKHEKQVSDVVITLTRLTFWLSLAVTSLLIGLGPFIFTVWTKGDVQFLPLLLLMIQLGVISESLWRVVGTVRMGTNRHRPIAIAYLLFSLVGFLIVFYIIDIYGLNMVALASSLSNLMMFIFSVYVTAPLIQSSFSDFMINIIKLPIKEIKFIIKKIRG